jgi:hypothetical protein
VVAGVSEEHIISTLSTEAFVKAICVEQKKSNIRKYVMVYNTSDFSCALMCKNSWKWGEKMKLQNGGIQYLKKN